MWTFVLEHIDYGLPTAKNQNFILKKPWSLSIVALCSCEKYMINMCLIGSFVSKDLLDRMINVWFCTDSLILDPISYKELHVRIAKALLILYRQQGSCLAVPVLILIGTRWQSHGRAQRGKKGIIYMRLCFFVDQQIIIGVSWQKDRSILVLLSWVCH